MLIDLQQFVFLGWFALAGALLNAVGDWLLLGFPVAGRDIKMELIAQKPARSVRLGVYIGMIAIPMWLCVLFPVAYLLRDAPSLWAAVTLVGLTLTISYSLVYHITYIFYDIAYRQFPDSVEAAAKEKRRIQLFLNPVALVTSIAIFIAGIIGGAPVFWLVANPMLLTVLFSAIARYTPAPFGGYLLTGAGSLVFALFTIATMLALPLS